MVSPLAEECFRRDKQDDDGLDHDDHFIRDVAHEVELLPAHAKVGKEKRRRDDEKGMVPSDDRHHHAVPPVARGVLPIETPVDSHDLGHSPDARKEPEDDLAEDDDLDAH